VDANRLRWGALSWLLTLQFFVVETVAELRLDGAYSRADDVISALGTADSPAALVMNGSFVLQAALILAGTFLLRPVLRGGAGGAAVVLLEIAAVGVLLVGLFPSDGNTTLHEIGAALYLVGGGLGLIALAYTVRPRSEAVGTVLAVLGMVGTAATVFFLTGVTEYLGEGGTERAAAYVLPIGLAVAGLGLWRLREPADAPVDAADAEEAVDAGAAGRRPTLRAERARARAERAARERERDAALEAAARRSRSQGDDSDDADTEEDPWGPARRRSRD
jgi:hypothetical membrane protein